MWTNQSSHQIANHLVPLIQLQQLRREISESNSDHEQNRAGSNREAINERYLMNKVNSKESGFLQVFDVIEYVTQTDNLPIKKLLKPQKSEVILFAACMQ